jgi:adenosylhomocysteine nucleosidase
MGAMPEEINNITEILDDKKTIELGGRTYYSGTIHGVRTVVVFSRWGKVAAATTVATLIIHFGITELIFTGVAGAIHPDLKIGDIVIGHKFYQHDLDARPIIRQFEIPYLKKLYFECEPQRLYVAEKIIDDLFTKKHLERVIHREELDQFGIEQPKLMIGDIASGDKFFSSSADKMNLTQMLPSVLCVEMEGAAVAQVCYEYGVPFTIFRTISDVADETSAIDFPSFIKNISGKYSCEIIKMYYLQL